MNKIEEMIKELCPNGVEWKKLGDVCTFQNGFAFKSQFFKENGNAIIRITNINKNTIDLNDVVFFDKSDYRENLSIYEIHNGDILVAMSGATTGKIGVYKGLDTCYLNQRVGTFRPFCDILSNQYLYHFLTTKVNDMYLLAGGGAQPNLSSIKLMSSLQIPLPPLPIQTEIVRILDKFVEQQEQLERLIELRKKQYEYYREEMLKPKEGEVEIPFSDCCTLVTKQTGFDYSSKIKPALKKQYEEGCIPFLQTRNFTNNVFDYNTEYYVPEEIVKQFPKIVLDEKCLLFSIVGASIGNVGLFPGDKKCFLGGAICVAKIKKDYDVSYLYYFMASSQGQLQIMQKTKGAGQATITIEDIRNFTVRIPSKEKMSSIVNALVALENSINALTSALEASKKRYEYYRDEMMRF